jgi:hypothetical protein
VADVVERLGAVPAWPDGAAELTVVPRPPARGKAGGCLTLTPQAAGDSSFGRKRTPSN